MDFCTPTLFIYSILPISFVVSIPFSFLASKHANIVNNSSVLQLINNVMVNHGLIIFSSLYFTYLYDNGKINYRIYWLRYFFIIVFSIILFIWWFGSSILERINIFTGGHCYDPVFITISQCHQYGNNWINGFDISGHFYILSIYITIIMNETYKKFKSVDFDIDNLSSKDKILLSISLITLLLWYFEFLITAIFFHSVWEKLIGMILGYIIPLLYIDV